MRGPRQAPRLPLDELERHIYLTTNDPNEGKTDRRHLASNRWIAELIEVSPFTVIRWRKEGVPMWAADRAACRLGHHPSYIWQQWTEEISCT